MEFHAEWRKVNLCPGSDQTSDKENPGPEPLPGNTWTLHNPNLTNPTVSCSTARKHAWIHCNRDNTNPTVGCSTTRKNAWIHTNMLTNPMFNSM